MRIQKAAVRRCSSKHSQYSQEYSQKSNPTQVFSCEYCAIFKNTFFTEHAPNDFFWNHMFRSKDEAALYGRFSLEFDFELCWVFYQS